MSLGFAICIIFSIGTDGLSRACFSLIFLHEFSGYVDLLFIMAAQVLAAGGPARTGKDSMDNHLLSLFMNAGAPVDQIDLIGDFGVTNVAMFTHLANGIKNTEGMRKFLKTVVHLDDEDGDPLTAVKARLDQSRILSVHTAACIPNEIEVKHTAECQVAHQPPEVALQELAA